MNEFKTEIVLGQVYRHKHSQIKGTAMSATFYLQGCVRVALLSLESKDNAWMNFDEEELIGIETKGNGGPRPDMPRK